MVSMAGDGLVGDVMLMRVKYRSVSIALLNAFSMIDEPP